MWRCSGHFVEVIERQMIAILLVLKTMESINNFFEDWDTENMMR